ncbi:hypothetical protein BaRGS_00000253, partial [Batillaria attramentaria]
DCSSTRPIVNARVRNRDTWTKDLNRLLGLSAFTHAPAGRAYRLVVTLIIVELELPSRPRRGSSLKHILSEDFAFKTVDVCLAIGRLSQCQHVDRHADPTEPGGSGLPSWTLDRIDFRAGSNRQGHRLPGSGGSRLRPRDSLEPRTYSGVYYPPKRAETWTPSGRAAPLHPYRKRTTYPPPHFQYQTHMTLSSLHRKAKLCSTMDYAPSPESFYAPDAYKSGDFSAFAASPNSLYMYDQELHDMQNTLNNGIFCGQGCGSSDPIALTTEGDFDLDPYYENSNSLEGYFTEAANSPLVSNSPSGQASSTSVNPSQEMPSGSMLTLLTPRKPEMKEGPTLAELNMNMNPILLEDIDSMMRNEEEEEKSSRYMEDKPASQLPTHEMLKTMVTCAQPVRTVNTHVKSNGFLPLNNYSTNQTVPMMSQFGAAPRLFDNSTAATQNIAVVPPIPVTSIKTEPEDPDEKLSLQKLLTSPPKSAASPPQTVPTVKQVMPVVGQKRAPPLKQVKSESVEEKWKEIEQFIHNPDASPSKKRRHGGLFRAWYGSEWLLPRKDIVKVKWVTRVVGTVSNYSQRQAVEEEIFSGSGGGREESGSSAILSDEEDFRSDMHGNYSDDDDSSDAESDISDTPLEESLTELAKKSKQYFWQYNVQAKGPKGTRLKLSIGDNDPHHPSNFEDPVFDANSTNQVGIRHGGKARKGDGNEVTPNPKKLCHIGHQLYKLNRQINSFSAANDQPASVRNKSRKEKNKLASRACRLKKKAQHEANKIKLKGLDCEQTELLDVVNIIWPALKERAKQQMKGIALLESKGTLMEQFNAVTNARRKTFIAGSTTDFVNEVIAKVEEGDSTGGLPIRVRK